MNKIKYVFVSLAIIAIFLFVYFVTYTFVEPKAYDFMVRNVQTELFNVKLFGKQFVDTKKQVYATDDVVIVVIDDKTVERYKWPWKREKLCKVLDYFSKYTEAKAIVHDVILVNLDTDYPDSDKKYFNSVNKNIIIEGFLPSTKSWGNDDTTLKQDKLYEEEFAKKFSIKNIEDKRKKTTDFYKSMMKMPKPYFDSVNHTGSVSTVSGFINGNIQKYAQDEVYRTNEYAIKYGNVYYPSLAMETFLVTHNNPNMIITDDYIEFPELNYKIKQKTTKYQSIVPIKFYKLAGEYSHPHISAIQIMDAYDAMENGQEPLIKPEWFKDKIIVFGANVPAGTSLNDNKNTPLRTNHPGVDMQATAIENIFHNDFLKIAPDYINYAIIILGILLVYCSITYFNFYPALLLTVSIIFGYLLCSAICFYYNIVINVITPTVMYIVTMIFAYLKKYITEQNAKEKVKNIMGKYMSEDVMKKIVQNIDNLGLGGKKATVTVLFSDIRGFTSMSEKMSAQQVSELLNEYFSEMEPIVTKYNGIINKFIGDAVMAVFGEPIQDENHAYNAVKCGYEMLQKVKELHLKWEKEGKPLIEIGVGVNTGEVFVGNIGSVNRMEYTVIGDTVNLASRLESYNKTYKTHMLISSSTYEASKNHIIIKKISNVEIRGKADKIDIYEVIEAK